MLLWFDGFDWCGISGSTTDLAYLYTIVGSMAPTQTGPRTGTTCASGTAATSSWYIERMVAPAATPTLVAGFGINFAAASDAVSRAIFAWVENATTHLTVVRNGSGLIEVYQGTAAGTLLGTGTIDTDNSAWKYIEIECSIHDSTGHVKVWIDDVLDINLTGLDTQNGGTGVVDRFRLGKISHASSADQDYDDFYCLDTSGSENNARLTSAVRVDCVRPSGAGSSTQWTPSAGNNYACVDDPTPNEDTDYVTVASAAQVDLYAMGDLPVSPAAIKAVMVGMIARKDDAGVNEVRTKLKSGATTADGATRTLTTSYLGFADISVNDPDTGTSWTESGVNAIEAGVERVT